jgi:hypothetical protein
MPPDLKDHDRIGELVADVRYIKRCLSWGSGAVLSIALAMFGASLRFWHEAEAARASQVQQITSTLQAISREVKQNSVAVRGDHG